MLKKQVLKVKNAHSPDIIRMTEANSIYVDNKFYREKMEERINDKDCSSYPVKVVALRIGWFLKSGDHVDGRYFLAEILRNEDLSYYNLKSLRMVIEFLYTKIKYTIIRLQVPFYLCNNIIFVTVAALNENLRSTYMIDHDLKIVTGSKESTNKEDILLIFLILNLIIVLLLNMINLLMFKMMGIEYLYRFWSYIDAAILIFSITILT